MEESNFRWVDIPLEDHPSMVMLPVFYRPGILTGITSSAGGIALRSTSSFHFRGPPRSHHLSGERAMLMTPFKVDEICRLAAKIAHGSAVGLLGDDTFKPLLPDLIRGKDEDFAWLVGSGSRSWGRRASLHHVELFTKGPYLVATVQLFARFGLHPLEAVVGRLT